MVNISLTAEDRNIHKIKKSICVAKDCIHIKMLNLKYKKVPEFYKYYLENVSP